MANKFTKSVLERQAKERRQHPDGQAEGERQAPASTAPGAFAPGGTAAEMPLQDMHSGAAAQAEHRQPGAAAASRTAEGAFEKREGRAGSRFDRIHRARRGEKRKEQNILSRRGRH